MSILRQIKDQISRTAQRALGIDDVRFKLGVALEKLSRIHWIENKLDLLERPQPVNHPLKSEQPIPEEVRNQPTLGDALSRLVCHKIEIASLIDVGASDGIWSKAFAKHFPGRQHLLVDANQVHRPMLARLCQENSNWRYAMTAVGATTGELYFDASDPLGGHLSATPLHESYRLCPVTTIDDLLDKQPLPAPIMIKLDTHGVELPILAGAAKTLKQTSVIVIEAYNFTFAEPAVPFWDLCRYMFEIGFRPLDVFDLLYREVDNAFWQFDLLFVRSDLPLFQDNRFFISGRH